MCAGNTDTNMTQLSIDYEGNGAYICVDPNAKPSQPEPKPVVLNCPMWATSSETECSGGCAEGETAVFNEVVIGEMS